MPSSRAPWVIGFPLVWASRTASSLHSRVETFWTFALGYFSFFERVYLSFCDSTNPGVGQFPYMTVSWVRPPQEQHTTAKVLSQRHLGQGDHSHEELTTYSVYQRG